MVWNYDLRSKLLTYSALLANIALIVLIAYTLAQITWQALLPSSHALAPTPDRPTTQGRVQAPFDLAQVSNWHLFGQPRLQAPPVIEKAPVTALNLRLAGVLYTTGKTVRPIALIAVGNRVEKAYTEGDQISPDVYLHRVLADRIILAHGDRLETLALPRETGKSVPSAKPIPVNSLARTAGRNNTVKAGKVMRHLRQTSQKSPDGLLDLAYTHPYLKNGRFVGLQLRPGRKQRLLQQLGLRTGDIVTELNGTRLTSAGQGMLLFQELLSTDQIDAKILRNNIEMPFKFLLHE